MADHAQALYSELLQRLERIELLLVSQVVQTPRPASTAPPLLLDQVMIDAFCRWSAADQHNSPRWVRYQRTYLEWWGQQLERVDLRAVSLADHVLPALDEAKGARAHRIAVIKRLYSWLRSTRFLITPAQDPTYGTLRVPQSTPAQWREQKTFDRAAFKRLLRYVGDYWRDPLTVLGGTGWHFSELERFARRGSVARQVLTCPRSKGGEILRTRVSPAVAAAARRLRARGTLDYKSFLRALTAASSAAGLEVKAKTGHLRPSVATHAVASGENLQAVADFLTHRTLVTTRRFYSTHAVPRKVRTLI